MVNQQLDHIYSMQMQVTKDVRDLANLYFMPERPQDERERGNPEYMKRTALATGAVEVVCALVNIFGVMHGLKTYSAQAAISSLTFTLNTNPFWVANVQYLMPLLNAAMNAFEDNNQIRSSDQPLWEGMYKRNKDVWLELLPAILFCLKGYGAMRDKSLEIKQAFTKFVNG